MIQSLTFSSINVGPKLLILGAVHGNEKCGTEAIRRVIAELESGGLKLARGQVTFVPICNPRAYEANVRFTERNLNRFLVPYAAPDTYEAKLGNLLCPIIAAHEILLDLHSVNAETCSFISVTENPRERAFAEALGAGVLMLGWEEAFAKTGKQTTDVKFADESIGTAQYMRRCGGIGLTLECGQHLDPEAPQVAYRAIHNTLRHFGLVEGEATDAPNSAVSQIIRMKTAYYRDEGAAWPENWSNFQPVKQGQVMAHHMAAGDLLAPSDGFIIMPKTYAEVGQEWFYFGTDGDVDLSV